MDTVLMVVLLITYGLLKSIKLIRVVKGDDIGCNEVAVKMKKL